jgi:hypothetical protein
MKAQNPDWCSKFNEMSGCVKEISYQFRISEISNANRKILLDFLTSLNFLAEDSINLSSKDAFQILNSRATYLKLFMNKISNYQSHVLMYENFALAIGILEKSTSLESWK